jgi:hypothetical protein
LAKFSISGISQTADAMFFAFGTAPRAFLAAGHTGHVAKVIAGDRFDGDFAGDLRCDSSGNSQFAGACGEGAAFI